MAIFSKYKNDFLYLLILTGIFLFLLPFFWGHMGNPIVDCFTQNALIPSDMLNGAVLYKDIKIPYPPLAYQINAFLFSIIKVHLDVILMAGSVSAFGILILLYGIARNFISAALSFSFSFLVLASCVFQHFIFNFIFPYADAALYGLLFVLFSLYFLFLYLKTSKEWLIPVSFLFFSLALLCKLDYLFIFFVLLFALIYKPLKPKMFLISLFAFLVFPVLDLLYLFSQGVKVSDFIDFYNILKLFSQTKAFKYFYTNYGGFYMTKKLLIENDINFIKFILLFLLPSSFYYFLISKLKSVNLKNIWYKSFLILLLLTLTVFIFILLVTFLNQDIYSWLAITTFLILLYEIFIKLKTIYTENKQISLKILREKYKQEDFSFLILVLFGCAISFKTISFVGLNVFGTFIFPLLFLINIIFITQRNFLIDKLDKKVYSNIWVILIIISSILFLFPNFYSATFIKNMPIKSDYGTLYSTEDYSEPISQTLKYLKINAKKDDMLMVFPQGGIFNFFSGLASSVVNYDFIPSTIELYGEDKIISMIKNNAPAYIIINNRNSADWGAAYFGEDYAKKVMEYISKNYIIKQEFGNKFKVRVYKKRSMEKM